MSNYTFLIATMFVSGVVIRAIADYFITDSNERINKAAEEATNKILNDAGMQIREETVNNILNRHHEK